MNFINVPNLPQKMVRLVLVDGRISPEIEEALRNKGINVIKTLNLQGVYEAVSCHPDIMLHHLGGKRVVYAPGTHGDVLAALRNYGFQLVKGSTGLSFKYPYNIAYNAARVGGFVFHNLKYTDPVLKRELVNAGIEPVHVNQGYSKCSVAVVDSRSIITADAGIAGAAGKKGIDCLLLEPDEGIVLPGLNCGFIGGSTGLISSNKLAVAGEISFLKSFHSILEFLNKRGIEVISLSQGHVLDIGSIIPLMEE